MAEHSEKKKLLQDEEENEPASPPTYYDSAQSVQKEPTEEEDSRPKNAVLGFLYDNRSRIPGYGLIKMVMGSSVYALYVLFALLVAYLLNQLDRYTLPIVTTSAGYDLHYGDLSCMQNKSLSDKFLNTLKDNGLSDYLKNCTTDDVKHNKSLCLLVDVELPSDVTYGNDTYYLCEYNHDGSGLLYQIVAGPVFNNLYPLAGFFTGFLADYGKRIIWLVISLFFWSGVTLVTGFAKEFWHLVLLRALLAIGAAGCSPFAVSILGDYFPPQFRATAISIYYWGIYIGYSLAFAIGNGIEKVLSWRWVFFLSGIVGLAAAPIILITVREPKRKKNTEVASKIDEVKLPLSRRILSLILTFILPGMLVLCLAGGVRNAGGYVWAYNTELFFKKRGFTGDQINHFMSWIPLVAGSIGAVVGGIISDVLVKGRGPYMRIWVLIVSQILAAPFAAGALFLPYPWCFLTLIPSNVIGEMWIGVTTAIVVDLAPTKIRTAAVALYLFIITIIGGNFNLLVSPLKSAFEKSFSELASYRWALFITFPGVYAFSSLLFLLAFFLMRLDLKRKQMFEQTMIVNRLPEEKLEEEEEPEGKAV